MVLPKEIAKAVPKHKLMSETEWRTLGVQQSQGWVHYMTHDPGKLSYLVYSIKYLKIFENLVITF